MTVKLDDFISYYNKFKFCHVRTMHILPKPLSHQNAEFLTVTILYQVAPQTAISVSYQ